MMTGLIRSIIFSATAILIAGIGAVTVGWYFSPPRLEHTQSETIAKVPELPEGIDLAFRCDGIIIAIIEKELEGRVSITSRATGITFRQRATPQGC